MTVTKPEMTPEEFDKAFMEWLNANNVTPLLPLLGKDGPAKRIVIGTKDGKITVEPKDAS